MHTTVLQGLNWTENHFTPLSLYGVAGLCRNTILSTDEISATVTHAHAPPSMRGGTPFLISAACPGLLRQWAENSNAMPSVADYRQVLY